jgi:hypothetical protein
MKPARTTQTDSPLRAALIVSFLSLAACAGAALYSIVAAPAQGSAISTLFPTALSLFPVVGLVAAVAFTQLLKRRRVPQLQAVAVDRG